MFKRIFAISLCLILLLSMFGACRRSGEVPDNTDIPIPATEQDSADLPAEDELPENTLALEDTTTLSTFERLQLDLREGRLNDMDFKTARISYAVAPDTLALEDVFLVRENELVDLSSDAQWLIDNYSSLDSDGQALVELMTSFTLQPTDSTSSLPIMLLPAVHASEDIPDPNDPPRIYPKEIDDNVYLTTNTPLLELPEDYEAFLIDTYISDASELGAPIDILDSSYRIVITTYPMLPNMDSMSYLSNNPDILGYDGTATFHIILNSMNDNDTVRAALAHELFHAYQYEMGYSRSSRTQEFFMESTAIWAVEHLDDTLPLPDRYDSYLYSHGASITISEMSDEEIKSWYQLPLFISKEDGNEDVVKDYIGAGIDSLTVIDALDTALADEENLHNLMARFGQVLFSIDPTEGIMIDGSAPYANHMVDYDFYQTESLDLMSLNEPGRSTTPWHMNEPGYYPVLVDLSSVKNAHIDITSTLTADEDSRKTGVIIFLNQDSGWTLVMDGTFNDFATHIDLNATPASEMAMIFYNHNDLSGSHRYAINIQHLITGEGSIDIHYEETAAITPESSDHIEKQTKTFDVQITEDIELFIPSEDGGNESEAIMQLMIGDVYFIKNFQAILNGELETEYKNGEWDRYVYTGDYNYQDGDAEIGSLSNPLINMDLDTLFGSDKSDSSDAGLDGLLKGLTGGGDSGDSTGLGGLLGEGSNLGSLPGMSGLESDLKDAMSELNDARVELNDLEDELGISLDSLLNPASGKLHRFKQMLETGTFHIYPQMPPTMESDPWIHYVNLGMRYDEDDRLKPVSEEGQTQLIHQLFPIWFRNPYYDAQRAAGAMNDLPRSPEDFIHEFSGTDQVTDQILAINGQFDQTNLYDSFNKGRFEFDLADFTEDKTGPMFQEIIYDEDTKTLIAELSAEYEKGDTLCSVTITMEYLFE